MGAGRGRSSTTGAVASLPEPHGDEAADRFPAQATVADEGAVAALVDDLPPERTDADDEVAARDLRSEDLEIARLVSPDDELGTGPCHTPVSTGPDLERARRRRVPAFPGLVDLRHELPPGNRVTVTRLVRSTSADGCD